MYRPPPTSTLFPYTTLSRPPASTRLRDPRGRRAAYRAGRGDAQGRDAVALLAQHLGLEAVEREGLAGLRDGAGRVDDERSEEHTSELQSRQYLVCRLLLEKK